MWSEAYDNQRRTNPPLRAAGETDARTLSEMLDARARDEAGSPAFYLRHLASTKEGTVEYLSLSFGELAEERDAWLQRLLERKVEVGDRVLVAVPLGLEFLAASYACLKLGVELIVLDPTADWDACRDQLRRLEPRLMIGSRERASAAKRFIGGLKSLDDCIRIPDRPTRLGSTGEPAGYYGNGANARLVLVEESEGGRAKATRFFAEQLLALARVSEARLGLGSGAKSVPTLPLLSLLYPALGVATVAPGEPGNPWPLDPLIDAVAHLDLSVLLGEEGFLRSILHRCQERSVTLSSVKEIAVFGVSSEAQLGRLAQAATPKASLSRVYSGGDTPLLATLALDPAAAEARDPTVPGKGICLGRALPEVSARIVPIDSRSGERFAAPEKLETRGMGEIAVRGILTGTEVAAERGRQREPNRTRWVRTGDVGFLDSEQQLWYCGRKEELVVTSFGTFYPDRCQLVFDKHPQVRRSALIALRKDGKARPGMVIETTAECLPKKKLEIARFSAELLQLGKDLEETRLITEFFFVKKLPELPKAPGKIDREALSARFSKKARF